MTTLKTNNKAIFSRSKHNCCFLGLKIFSWKQFWPKKKFSRWSNSYRELSQYNQNENPNSKTFLAWGRWMEKEIFSKKDGCTSFAHISENSHWNCACASAKTLEARGAEEANWLKMGVWPSLAPKWSKMTKIKNEAQVFWNSGMPTRGKLKHGIFPQVQRRCSFPGSKKTFPATVLAKNVRNKKPNGKILFARSQNLKIEISTKEFYSQFLHTKRTCALVFRICWCLSFEKSEAVVRKNGQRGGWPTWATKSPKNYKTK